MSGQNSSERSKGQQKKEGGLDVRYCTFVTFAVFHLEMSALNAEAPPNTVGGCRCRDGHNPKIKNRENVKIKAMGVSGENSSERTKGQKNKRGGVDVP